MEIALKMEETIRGNFNLDIGEEAHRQLLTTRIFHCDGQPKSIVAILLSPKYPLSEVIKKVKMRAMRTNGAYQAGEQDNLIVQKLQEDKDAYGLLQHSIWMNRDTLERCLIHLLDFELIAS